MLSKAPKRFSQFLTLLLAATVLSGCFGKGEGPTPIAGTPAPPPPVIPPGFCDPIFNFEDACGAVSFINFEGGDAAIIDNPDVSGLNTSDKVARMLKFEVVGGGTFGGTQLALPSGIDFTAGEAFTMKVWSSRPVPVLFKFEGLNQERSLDHSGSGMWEEICYDFTGTTAGPAATGLTIIFDLTVMGDAGGDPDNWTFYFDEITQVADCAGGGGPGAPIALPVTFDDAGVDYELVDFGGAATTLVADPADAANTVASTDKFAGAELWAGTTVADASGFGALPFTATETTMTLRVYSPDAGIPVRLKVEDRTDNTISVETEATTTVAGAWETLTFDFSNEVAGTAALNLANTYDKASVFFNFGTDGNTAGDRTYLWDDLTFGTGGGGPAGITLPVTFQDGDATFYELTDFGGAATTLVADPADAANTVASTDKFAGAELWAGTTVADASGFGALPFTATETTMTLRVYSPDAGIPVRLKVEDRTDNTISVETEATTTVAGAWETLTFDFSNEVAGTAALNLANTYDKASVFFNFGTDGNTAGDRTYLWDDLAFVTGGGGSSSVDFEGGSYTFSDFGGATTAVVANPNASGINMSTQVAEMQKFAGEVFAGSTLDLGGPVDLAAADSYTMKVLANRSVVVTFKLETGQQETTATYSGSGDWEELCFDFTGVAATVTGITVIFDNGTAGDAANFPDDWTFQFDDIQQIAGSCPATGGGTFQTITFDDPAVTYTLTDFGGNNSTVTNDPVGGANMVVQTVKTGTAELWAGTTVSTEANEAVPTIPLDASNTQMSVLVYSPDAGIPVRLKIEDASDNTITVETEATTTVVNAWETLTFDFANEAAGTAAFNAANTYNKISIFFNFGTDGATAGERTYYFDDIAVVTGGGPAAITLPVTFEDAAVDYELTDFGGAATTLVADPDDAANTVASTDKFAGAELWAGTTVANTSGFGALPFTATETSMTLRVYSPDAGIPVRLKVEDITNGAISVETEATTTVAGAWETLTFDFSNEVAGTAALNLANTYDKASVFFNFGTDGNTAGDRTYLWDDLTFGAGGPAAITLPVTFEDAAVDYELTDFGGAATTLVADPDDAANTVASTDKFAGAELWAGTTVADTSGFGALPFTATETSMTLRVYSPDAGIPVRLKVEDITNGAISVETEATTTVAGAWETLTFDFSNEVAGTAALNLANTYDKASVFFNFGTDGNTAGDRTYLWDDLTFVTGGGSGGAGGELAVNGDFETGDLSGWEIFDSSNSGNGGTISVVSPGASGTFAGNLNITAPGNPTLKQPNLAAGQLTPNQVVTVTFDWRGTDANGGVANIVLFSELAGGGVSDTFTIFDGAGFPANWTTVGPLDITTGNDVSGGVTLQITAICGGAAGCESNVFIDNVSITTQ